MKNKQWTALGLLMVSILAAILLSNNYLPQEKQPPADQTTEPVVFTKVSEKQSSKNALPALTEANGQNPPIDQLQSCFPGADVKNVNKDTMKAYFEKKSDFSPAQLQLEQYELVAKNNQKIVVQYTPGEESKNQVRAFNVNKTDGFPDRITKFPQSTGELSKRLDGALTLGKLISKTETTHQAGTAGELLEIEKDQNAILWVRYSEPGLEFSCDKIKCKCTKMQN